MKSTRPNTDYISQLDLYLKNEEVICPPPPASAPQPPTFCLGYPDTYEHGLPNLGISILSQLLTTSGAIVSRTYLPDFDKYEVNELLPIETDPTGNRLPVRSHNIVSFNISFETLGPNVLKMLKLSNIPSLAVDRDENIPFKQESYPLIIGSGAVVSYNPAPFWPFFDLITIGDGEEMIQGIVDIWRKGFDEGWTRKELLINLATNVPGVYVPSLYKVDFQNGITDSHQLIDDTQGPMVISRQKTKKLDENLSRTIYCSPLTVYGTRSISLEVARGCPGGCRFCYMGNFLRPSRFMTVEDIKKWVILSRNQKLTLRLFYEALPQKLFEEMFEMLDEEIHDMRLNLGSFRVDQLSEQAVRVAGKGKLQCLIVAPETTEALRPVINKKTITDDHIFKSVEWSHKYGIPNFGLYLMIGLPTETIGDITDLADLAVKTRQKMNEVGNSAGIMEVHMNTFFPKPWTPLQWTGVDLEGSKIKLTAFINRLKEKGINVHHDEIKTVTVGGGDIREQFNSNTIVIKTVIGGDAEFIQTMIVRGDRRMAQAIKTFCDNDGVTAQDFISAMETHGLYPQEYLRERTLTEKLPWDFIDTNIDRKFLEFEWHNANSDRSPRA